jgi:tetratricopeptide (TPR) repeat protein
MFAFDFHWKWVQDTDLQDGPTRRCRAYIRAQLGQWQEAAAECLWVRDHQPPADMQPWLRMVSLLALAGHVDEARQLARKALQRSNLLVRGGSAAYLAHTLSLLEGTVDDACLPVHLAETARLTNKEPWVPPILALAYFRAGQLDQALQWSQHRADAPCRPTNLMILALIHQRRGQPEEAKKALAEVEQWFQELAGGEPHLLVRCAPMESLEFLVLLNEAQSKIGTNSGGRK